MKIELRDRDKRALLALGGAFIVYLALSLLVIPAYQHVKDGAGAVQGKEEELRKYRRAFINRDHYSQLLQQAHKSVDEGKARLVRGDNASLAQVELQNIVSDAQKKVGLPPTQYSVSSAKKKDEYFNEITISLAFDGTLNQLVSFLGALRESPEFVTVRSLQVTPLQAAVESPAKGELKKDIHASVTISALLSIVPPAPTSPVVPAATKG